MWTKGSSRSSGTPENARRTGKPSPSKPEGAVVTVSTGRNWASGAMTTRGRDRTSVTVTAGISPPPGKTRQGQHGCERNYSLLRDRGPPTIDTVPDFPRLYFRQLLSGRDFAV